VNTSTANAGPHNSNQGTQSAGQSQRGGGSRVQVVHQDAPVNQTTSPTGTSTTRPIRGGVAAAASGAATAPGGRATGSWELATHAWSPRAASSGSAGALPPARRSPGPAPQDPRSPLPQDSTSLGAAGGPPSGVSLWVFAALLIPFALTAPWWARRERLSAVRRLAGLSLRLERPG
jgi:hypothetical protein